MRVTAGSPIVAFFEQTFVADYAHYQAGSLEYGQLVEFYQYQVQPNELALVDNLYLSLSKEQTILPALAYIAFGIKVSEGPPPRFVPIAIIHTGKTAAEFLEAKVFHPNIILDSGRILSLYGELREQECIALFAAALHLRRYKKHI